MSEEKNTRIAKTMSETFKRRSGQVCRTFELKVNKSRLNREQEEALRMLFIEAKWCYNYLLDRTRNNGADVFEFDYREFSRITHKDKDMNDVEVDIRFLTSSLKADIVDSMRARVKTLAKLKKKGRKVGPLRFKSEYTSLKFKQNGVTHKIVSGNRIKLQGIKKPVPVNGMKQLSKYGGSMEVTSAVLNSSAGDYYIYLTVYYGKEEHDTQYANRIAGIDMGCQTSLTLSDGTKINALVEEGEPIKRLQRRIKRQKKGSNNRRKTILKLRKAYRNVTNKKDDAANKIVSGILKENETVVIQDEQLNSWKKRHGKKVQHGILGRVKSKLKASDRVFVLNRFVPTTKFCHDCGKTHDGISLWDRTFVCPSCGSSYDRDVHAAQNMVWMYDNLRNRVGLGESDFKRAEFDEEVRRLFSGWDSRTLKHEDANPSD